ncbi:hypothetical protein BSKO_01301 [Bryopsis sp. KO-2023]|nr:hypothetical protein BSKO_01301 [Bryopsis sp. KO-2023]
MAKQAPSPFKPERLGESTAGLEGEQQNAEFCGKASTGRCSENGGQIAFSVGYGRLSLIRYNANCGRYEWTSNGQESYLIVRMFLEGLHAADLAPIRRGVGSSLTASGLAAFLSRKPSLGGVSDEFFGLLWSELRHVIWTEISLLCDIAKGSDLHSKEDVQEKLHACLTLICQLAKRFPHLKALYHSWDDLAGNVPDRIIDAQCPGIIHGIRDSIKFLRDCFEEGVREVSEALHGLLENPLSDNSAKVWLEAMVAYFDLTTKMLGEFAVFSEILAGPARAPKRACAKSKFKSTIHTVNMIATLIKRQSSTIDDAEMQILKLTGRLSRSQRIDAWKLLMQFGVSRAISAARLLQSTLIPDTHLNRSSEQSILGGELGGPPPGSMQEIRRDVRNSEELCLSELSLMATNLNLGQDSDRDESVDRPPSSPLVMGILSSASHMRSTGAARSAGMIGSPAVGLFYPPKSPGLRAAHHRNIPLFDHASCSTVHCLFSWFLHHLREDFELNHREITLGWRMIPARDVSQGQSLGNDAGCQAQTMSDPTEISTGEKCEAIMSKSFTSGCLKPPDSLPDYSAPASFSQGSPPSKLPALTVAPSRIGQPLLKSLQASQPLGARSRLSHIPLRTRVDVQPLPRQVLDPISSTAEPDTSSKPEKSSGGHVSFLGQRILHWTIPTGVLLAPWLMHHVYAIDDEMVEERWGLLPDALRGSTAPAHYLKAVELLNAIEKGIFYSIIKKDKLAFEKSESEFLSPTVAKAREMLMNLCKALKSVHKHPHTQQSDVAMLRGKVELLASEVVEVFVNWAVRWQPLYPTGATLQHLCIIHSDMLKMVDALNILLDCMHDSAKFTTPPWMKKEEAQPEAMEMVEMPSSSRAPVSDPGLDKSGKISAFRGEDDGVDDANSSTNRSVGLSGDSIRRNQVCPIGGGCEEGGSTCTSRGTSRWEGRSDDNESERRQSSSQAGPRSVRSILESVGPEYPSLVKKTLRMNFKSVLAARRFKWRQANVGEDLHSQQGNVWLDFREARYIKHFQELIGTMRLEVGGLTDKLSQEFREAAQTLWASNSPSTWSLRTEPQNLSTGASHVIDHLLKPLSNTLDSLDARSRRVLLGSAFASSAQTECELISTAIQNARHRVATKHYATQLKLDVAAMRGVCVRRRGDGELNEPSASKEAVDNELMADQFGDSERGVLERVECIVKILSTPQKEIKLGKLRGVCTNLPDAEKWERLPR